MNRRHFVRLVGIGLNSVYLGGLLENFSGCTPSLKIKNTDDFLEKISPFDRHSPSELGFMLSEDSPEFPHEVLRNKKKWLTLAELQSKDLVPEEVDLAIIGGGMSGLLSAHFLQNHKIILLEQAKRIGGNAKGSHWHGIDYSLATTYFSAPQPNSEIYKFFQATGLLNKLKYRKEHDPLAIENHWYPEFWFQGTVPESRPQFQRMRTHFEQMLNHENGLVYPDIPIPENISFEDRKKIETLDQISLNSYLEQVISGPLHPHLKDYTEHYCWDAFGASSTEISAAHGLNFLVSEYKSTAYFPGGNAAIGEKIIQLLLKKINPPSIRPSSVVFDVQVKSDHVLASYLTHQHQIIRVKAKAAILACPKFVATHLIDHLEMERHQAIKSLKYRSFIVANLLIQQKLNHSFFEAFLSKNITTGDDTKRDSHHQGFINITNACSSYENSPVSVLTLYRPFPYDSGRKELFNLDEVSLKKIFEKQIYQEILPLLNISRKNLVGIKITRWGHGMPVAQIGNISSGKIDILRKPFKDRIFFVEQDNWTLPAFETAFYEAQYWSKKIDSFLSQSS